MRLSSLLGLFLVSGCWVPNPPDGAFACNPTGKACPDGYSCVAGSCWKNGHTPDLSVVQANTDLGGVADDQGPSLKALGEKCSSADLCNSGFCVDGVCCNSACNGQCEACDTSNAGTCSPVSGPPHGARAACAGAGTLCGGSCDGMTTAACIYPSAQTICGAACDGKCDGAGGCSTGGGGTCPNGFACGTNTCLTSCSKDTDCQTNFTCVAPNCVRKPESDCLDGLDNNGDGLADCADPTCSTQVTCVPSAATGNELGEFTTSACGGSYATTEHFNQSLNVPTTCSGCGCSPYVDCAISIYFDYSHSDCTTASLVGTYHTAGTACLNGLGGNPLSVSESITLSASACNPVQGTPNATSWGTSSNFCAVTRSSATCSGNNVCVAKPASAPICVRIPSAGAACPAGYGGTPKGTWYPDNGVQDNRTCACACSGSGASCQSTAYMASGTACPADLSNINASFLPLSGTCVARNGNAETSWSSLNYMNQYPNSTPATPPTCSVSSTAITSGTTATATGGSTICCQ